MEAAVTSEVLTEREEELAQLEAALSSSAHGVGRLVVLRGPAGIGKSALLRALRARAVEQGMCVLTAKGSELEREFPFGVARQLFLTAVRERPEAMDGAAALGGRALDPEATPAGDSAGHAVLHGLHWLAVNLAIDRPLLLAVDDVQWVDPASLRYLAYLARRVDELSGMLVVAQRTGEPAADTEAMASLTMDPEALVIDPHPLSVAGVHTILADAWGHEPDAAIVSACRDATGGNPFLLRQLARSADATAAGGVPEMGPRSVAAAVMIRIARMSPIEPAVANALAVLGDDTPLRDVAHLAGVPVHDAQRAAERLARAEIVARGDLLGFVHPIVRRAVYSDMDRAERGRLHEHAAQLRLAEGRRREAVPHLVAAPASGNPDLVAHLLAAADDATHSGDAASAADLLERALLEPPPPGQRGEVLEALGRAELVAGRPRAIEHLQAAFEAVEDPVLRGRIAGPLARALLFADRGEDALLVLDRAQADVRRHDRELALLLEGEFAAAVFVAPAGNRLIDAGKRLGRLQPELHGTTPGERICLGALALHRAAQRTDPEEARDLARRALGDGELLADQGPDAVPFVLAAFTLAVTENYDEALAAFDAQLALAQRRGSPLGFVIASIYRGHVLRRLGELARAEAEGRAAWDLCREHRFDLLSLLAFGLLLDALTESGQLDAAEAELKASGLESITPELTLRSGMVAARGRLRLAQRRPAEAVTDFEGCLHREATRGSHFDFAGPPAARACALLGDRDRALEIATAETERWRAWGTPRALGSALCAQGAILGGSEGLALLREAVQILRTSPARYDRAVALFDLGSALRRSNQRAEGREHLRESLDLATRCGAANLVDQAAEELRAAGGRVHREYLSGVEALTPSELRIARLAADGLSNPEIAQSLFITRKTVEMHLGRVYRKLDLTTRAQLPAALDATA